MLVPADSRPKSVVVVCPSFESEWAVFVSSGPEGPQIVLRALRKPLAAESPREARSKNGDVQFIPIPGSIDPKAVAIAAKHVTQATATISRETASKLERAWQAALARVRYSEELRRMLAGADGTVYHFSQCSEQGCLTGRTWSPERGSVSQQLVEVGDAMRSYVAARGADKETRLVAKIDAFMEAIHSRE